MAISSVDMEKQRYSQELAAYTFRQWNRASQSAEEQGAPNSYKAISRKISAVRDSKMHQPAENKEPSQSHRACQVV